jgi:hypothetical protein
MKQEGNINKFSSKCFIEIKIERISLGDVDLLQKFSLLHQYFCSFLTFLSEEGFLWKAKALFSGCLHCCHMTVDTTEYTQSGNSRIMAYIPS